MNPNMLLVCPSLFCSPNYSHHWGNRSQLQKAVNSNLTWLVRPTVTLKNSYVSQVEPTTIYPSNSCHLCQYHNMQHSELLSNNIHIRKWKFNHIIQNTGDLDLKWIKKNYTAISAHHFNNSACHQWQILIWRSGLAEGNTKRHCTILLDLPLDQD